MLDDSESANLDDLELFKVMNQYGQRIPAGVSKEVSRFAKRAGLHSLRWSCFAISTGPHSVIK
ncbi:hypothetical protein, partial [Enterobacter hormaechei]|uniref:hypothetical protein n=1 Tax=Enterobacter hormaechei TaxID=158836 RepID=UPI0019533025